MNSERRAPVQATPRGPHAHPAGTVSWSEHEEAWREYAGRFGYSGQSAERIAERGGFSYGELVMLLGGEPATWQPTKKERA